MAPSKPIDGMIGVNFADILQSTDAKYNHLPLGTRLRARNGRDYIFVEGSTVIADATAVVLTEPGMTVAAGAGSWTTRSGSSTPSGTWRCWVEKNSI